MPAVRSLPAGWLFGFEASMSEVPTRIRAPEAPVLEISINSYDTPENELIEASS